MKYATSLAKEISASIALLYIVPSSPVQKDSRSMQVRKIWEGHYDALGRQILEKFSSIPEKEGVACEPVTEVGNASWSILTVAKERGSEMIVVGLQGLHGLAKVRSLGSISRRIIENSTIPVITVP